jgi:hypothetical protein
VAEAEVHEDADGLGRVAVAPVRAFEDIAEVATAAGGAADLDPAAADRAALEPEDDGQVVDGSGGGLPGGPDRGQELGRVLEGVGSPVEVAHDVDIARVGVDGRVSLLLTPSASSTLKFQRARWMMAAMLTFILTGLRRQSPSTPALRITRS